MGKKHVSTHNTTSLADLPLVYRNIYRRGMLLALLKLGLLGMALCAVLVGIVEPLAAAGRIDARLAIVAWLAALLAGWVWCSWRIDCYRQAAIDLYREDQQAAERLEEMKCKNWVALPMAK